MDPWPDSAEILFCPISRGLDLRCCVLLDLTTPQQVGFFGGGGVGREDELQPTNFIFQNPVISLASAVYYTLHQTPPATPRHQPISCSRG